MLRRNEPHRDQTGHAERGIALLVAMMILFLLSVAGFTSLNLAVLEVRSAQSAQDEKISEHLAEAAGEAVVEWFHHPGSAPTEVGETVLTRRFQSAEGAPSFFDAQGISQFKGTTTSPDLFFDAADPHHDQLLNSPTTGLFRSLRGLGRILKLKVYGPAYPGSLCTVEVTAATGRASAIATTLSMELGSYAIPPLRAAVQVGGFGDGVLPGAVTPVWAHWGDVKARGDVRLRNPQAIATKSGLAPVNGQSYTDMSHPEDRWFDLWVGGRALFAEPIPGSSEPSNLHQQQDPTPGLKMDHWDYAMLKQAALRFGSYYAMDREGLLYSGGIVREGQGVPADQVFESPAVGDHHGLVFIDTLDQQPPSSTNLGTLLLNTDYAEGLFVINAHVIWRPKGAGKSVPALSPPPEGQSTLGLRVPVQLSGIHLHGVLYALGRVVVEGQPRLYGALVSEGMLVHGTSPDSRLEVWYDHDLYSGLLRGIPLVYPAPGTRQVKS